MEYGMGKTAIFALISYFFAMALLVLNSNAMCGAESDEEIIGPSVTATDPPSSSHLSWLCLCKFRSHGFDLKRKHGFRTCHLL
nr:hypothetical protein CFP56_26159 [Quercus suber]